MPDLLGSKYHHGYKVKRWLDTSVSTEWLDTQMQQAVSQLDLAETGHNTMLYKLASVSSKYLPMVITCLSERISSSSGTEEQSLLLVNLSILT